MSLISLVRANELAAFHAHVAGIPYKPPATGTTTSTSGTTSTHLLHRHDDRRERRRPSPSSLRTAAPTNACRSAPSGAAPPRSPPAASTSAPRTTGSLATRDSGRSLYANVSAAGGGQALEILTPIYRHNVVPASVAGRRASFAGWVREVLAPTVLLAQSMDGLPEGAARLRHRARGADDVYSYGTPPADAARPRRPRSAAAGRCGPSRRRPPPRSATTPTRSRC